LQLDAGETVAIVGESGCGKSVTALSIMRLIPSPPGVYASGSIHFQDQPILSLSEHEMESIRGNHISMIFQEPMTSLNPIFTIGDQIAEAIMLHQKKDSADARKLALSALKMVAIPSPENRIDQYPHELSGGMKQRVMIAMAIVCNPALLIADEPTTALDVTIQAQILELLAEIREKNRMAILLITHNLGIVAEFANRVVVMYAGQIVEEAPVEILFASPAHPYTQGLLNSLPSDVPGKKLEAISGSVPHPVDLPQGCSFHPRCKDAMPICRESLPPVITIQGNKNHRAVCWLYDDEGTAAK
jgi:oligopeptide/dipeptide ABC transporter ATP-binding protein